MSLIQTLSKSGLMISARDFASTLSDQMRERFLTYIDKLELTGDLTGPLVRHQGPGRYIVSIPDETNRLVEFILITSAETAQTPTPRLLRGELIFYPIDVDTWQIPRYELWSGRPGEEQFQIPNIVIDILELIRKGSVSKFYRQRPDGIYEIFIPEKNIRGTAVWV